MPLIIDSFAGGAGLQAGRKPKNMAEEFLTLELAARALIGEFSRDRMQ